MAAPTIDGINQGSVANKSETNPATVTIPSGDGDLLLAFVCSGPGTGRYCSTPSNWTLLAEEIAGDPNCQIFYRANASAVSGSVDFTPVETYTNVAAIVLRISGADYTTLVADTINENGTGNSTDVNCPSVTVPAADSLLLRSAMSNRNVTFSLSGYTEEFDTDFSANSYSQALYSKSASSGASGTAVITSSINWSDDYVGATVAVGPAGASQSIVPHLMQLSL